jgi:hypothetical protein
LDGGDQLLGSDLDQADFILETGPLGIDQLQIID